MAIEEKGKQRCEGSHHQSSCCPMRHRWSPTGASPGHREDKEACMSGAVHGEVGFAPFLFLLTVLKVHRGLTSLYFWVSLFNSASGHQIPSCVWWSFPFPVLYSCVSPVP